MDERILEKYDYALEIIRKPRTLLNVIWRIEYVETWPG